MSFKILTPLVIILAIVNLSACSTMKIDTEGETTKVKLEDVVQEGDILVVKEANDPWYGYNRWMYNFNAKFDRYIFIPTVKTYRFILPGFVRKGVHNVFNNIGEVKNLANTMLQAKPTQFAHTLGRFAINSTIGIGGILDPATRMGLEYQREDFGQTLGRWGVGAGPYFVMPILGPSTLRDAPSVFVDRIFNPLYEPEPWLAKTKSEEQLAIGVLDAIDTRDNVSFRYYEMGSPFEYYWVRDLWIELRNLEISK